MLNIPKILNLGQKLPKNGETLSKMVKHDTIYPQCWNVKHPFLNGTFFRYQIFRIPVPNSDNTNKNENSWYREFLLLVRHTLIYSSIIYLHLHNLQYPDVGAVWALCMRWPLRRQTEASITIMDIDDATLIWSHHPYRN